MKNKIIIATSGFFLALNAYGQQDIAFSQYFFNPMYVNPAYAGSHGTFSGTAVYRTQWVGMSDAPVTGLVGIHDMVPNSNVGLGIQFYNDRVGPLTSSTISGIFAYHIPLTENLKLALGIEGCADNLTINYNKVTIQDVGDPAFMGASSAWLPDFNAGAYLYNEAFFAGFSTKHLLQPSFGKLDAYNTTAEFYRSYYLTAGVIIPLGENVGLRPSVLAKYVQGAPIDLDIDASIILYDRFYIGAGLRTDQRININGMDNIIVATIEYDVANRIRIGYACDLYLSDTGPHPYSTHEIMLGWDVFSNKTKMTSPKYF